MTYTQKSAILRYLADVLRIHAGESAVKISVCGNTAEFVHDAAYLDKMSYPEMADKIDSCVNVLKQLPRRWRYATFIYSHYTNVSVLDIEEERAIDWARRHKYAYTISAQPSIRCDLEYWHYKMTVTAGDVDITFSWMK